MPWEIGNRVLQARNADNTAWSIAAPNAFSLQVLVGRRFRGSFSVAGGDEGDPISAGTLAIQEYRDGVWTENFAEAKNIAPAHGIFPPNTPWPEWTIIPGLGQVGNVLRIRLRVTWGPVGDFFSSEIAVTVLPAPSIIPLPPIKTIGLGSASTGNAIAPRTSVRAFHERTSATSVASRTSALVHSEAVTSQKAVMPTATSARMRQPATEASSRLGFLGPTVARTDASSARATANVAARRARLPRTSRGTR